ncbi:MAG: type II secretion system protein [Minisyncoccia bacterium]
MKKFLSSPVKGQSSNVKGSSGFTLLELLIVVSIIAILSVALVLVLDPAETLKKSRDAQRMSDLSTMKTAIALYLTSTTTPYLAGTSNTLCKATPSISSSSGDNRIYYSSASSVTDTDLDGSTITTVASTTVGSTLLGQTNGGGWIPINFDVLTGGSPISNIPVDPVNTISNPAGVASTDLVYRYACSETPLAFEIDAQLESTAYTVADNKRTSDGGNSTGYYEVGTNLKILGAGGTTSLDF